jgi:hypothetical protein
VLPNATNPVQSTVVPVSTALPVSTVIPASDFVVATSRGEETEEAKADEESEPIVLLIVAIVAIVAFGCLFGVLMYKERRRESLEAAALSPPNRKH